MSTVRQRVVHANPPRMEFKSIEAFDAHGRFLDSLHSDEAKATRPFRPLIVDNGDVDHAGILFKLFSEVFLSGANTQTKYA